MLERARKPFRRADPSAPRAGVAADVASLTALSRSPPSCLPAAHTDGVCDPKPDNLVTGSPTPCGSPATPRSWQMTPSGPENPETHRHQRLGYNGVNRTRWVRSEVPADRYWGCTTRDRCHFSILDDHMPNRCYANGYSSIRPPAAVNADAGLCPAESRPVSTCRLSDRRQPRRGTFPLSYGRPARAPSQHERPRVSHPRHPLVGGQLGSQISHSPDTT